MTLKKKLRLKRKRKKKNKSKDNGLDPRVLVLKDLLLFLNEYGVVTYSQAAQVQKCSNIMT